MSERALQRFLSRCCFPLFFSSISSNSCYPPGISELFIGVINDEKPSSCYMHVVTHTHFSALQRKSSDTNMYIHTERNLTSFSSVTDNSFFKLFFFSLNSISHTYNKTYHTRT